AVGCESIVACDLAQPPACDVARAECRRGTGNRRDALLCRHAGSGRLPAQEVSSRQLEDGRGRDCSRRNPSAGAVRQLEWLVAEAEVGIGERMAAGVMATPGEGSRIRW